MIQRTSASAHPSLSQPGYSGKGLGMDVQGGRGQRSPFKPQRPIRFQSRQRGRGEPQSGEAALCSESTDIRYLDSNATAPTGDEQLPPPPMCGGEF